MDVKVNVGLKGHDAPGVHAQQFTRAQVTLVNRAARVQKRPAVTLQTFHDESLAAKQADADFLVERNAHTHAFGGAQERVLLRNEFAADFG